MKDVALRPPREVVDAGRADSLSGRSLIDGIRIDYGPVDVLGRFFLQADTAARDRGVTLAFGTLDDIVAVNRKNPATWRPILPIFDPTFGKLDDTNTIAILGYNRRGEIVATQAARLFNWTTTDFAQEAANLRLFYSDPDRDRLSDERIDVTASSAKRVTGRVAYSGGVWFHPNYRGLKLTAILPRISRALAFTRWFTDVTTTIMAERIVDSGVATRCGYTDIGWDVTLQQTRTGTVRCALLSMHTAEMLRDLRDFAEHLESEVDRRVYDRAVEQPGAAGNAA